MAVEIEILFEDSDLLVVSKPAGLLSESSGGNEESMLSRVCDYLGKRAVLYHRIDRGTTGCLIFGKTGRFNREITQLFSEKKIRKEYWAIVTDAWPKGQNKIETRIEGLGSGKWHVCEKGGKPALTTFRELAREGEYVWLAALPKTGRTHQIRLHCLAGGSAIVGDKEYGEVGMEGALMLHARSVRFRHPGTGESMDLRASVPAHWEVWCETFPKMKS